jgi:hypothetical protein
MALSIYPLRAARLPLLAQDYAYVLIRQGHFLVAHALLERAIAFIQRPEEQALVWSTLAWAAGAAGRRERFAEVEPTVLERIQVHADFAAAALIHLAEGSRALRAWDAAVRYASEAADVARQRGDAPLQREATELMASAVSRAPHPHEVPASEETDAFARRLASRLRRWRAPALASAGAHPT